MPYEQISCRHRAWCCWENTDTKVSGPASSKPQVTAAQPTWFPSTPPTSILLELSDSECISYFPVRPPVTEGKAWRWGSDLCRDPKAAERWAYSQGTTRSRALARARRWVTGPITGHAGRQGRQGKRFRDFGFYSEWDGSHWVVLNKGVTRSTLYCTGRTPQWRHWRGQEWQEGVQVEVTAKVQGRLMLA